MIEGKNNYSSEQLDRLVNEIEGRLNDFETGISDKEETIKSFASFIYNCAKKSTINELDRILKKLRPYLTSEAYIAINARMSNLMEGK